MKYRADINGLRAIAVLSVVIDHAGVGFLTGGFYGVDVFFVISGYLISGIILSEVQEGNFSVRHFYERRIRRIFPALAATMLASIILACFYFLPVETRNFSYSMLAATFCVSNIYFWRRSGYFEALATEKPLLHTWSLAVEEQFYFLFPVFVLIAHRLFRRRLGLVILLTFVVSLAIGMAGAYLRPVAAFYLAPTRAWELLLGALISLNLIPEARTRLMRELATLAGLAMIVFSMVEFSGNTLYPGIGSLLPCFGSALIIATGRSGSSMVGAALSSRPMVFIGLISYSLYLWHWPILVFHRLGLIPTLGYPAYLDKAIVIAVSIVVAALSWKFIETPFRDKRMSAGILYRFAATGALLLVSAGVGLIVSGGFTARFSPQVARTASFLEYDPRPVSRAGTCFFEPFYSGSGIDMSVCLHEDASRKNYLLIGDSHAAHLWYGLANVFPQFNIMQATSAGCKPTLDPIEHEDKRHCRPLMDYVAFDYLPAHRVDALLIEAIWRKEDLPLLPRTLAYAKQHADEVVLFGPMVQYDASLPRLLAVSLMRNDPAYPGQHRLEFLAQLDREMAEIARQQGVRYVSFFDILCNSGDCKTVIGDGIPMLYDYGHLTVEGSVLVATYLRDHQILP